MIYKDYMRNHAVLPGRQGALEKFLKQDYKGMRHKWNNGFNSNSEDALTWSCFDVLNNLPQGKKVIALNELLEDAYQGGNTFTFSTKDKISIQIGKQYDGHTIKESTEVDASIELPDKLIFFEAKLYSAVSAASPPEKRYDQIAKKIRIGFDISAKDNKEFFLVFLDIAPLEKLTRRKNKESLKEGSSGFEDKWKSAWLYKYYKNGRNGSLKPLREVIKDIQFTDNHKLQEDAKHVANNMGWLTWSDLFKIVLRAMV